MDSFLGFAEYGGENSGCMTGGKTLKSYINTSQWKQNTRELITIFIGQKDRPHPVKFCDL